MASTAKTADIGLIGLAVMGENLVLNMESHGFTVAVLQPDDVAGRCLPGGPGQGQEVRRGPLAAGTGRISENTAQDHDHGHGGRRR